MEGDKPPFNSNFSNFPGKGSLGDEIKRGFKIFGKEAPFGGFWEFFGGGLTKSISLGKLYTKGGTKPIFPRSVFHPLFWGGFGFPQREIVGGLLEK